MNIKKIKKFKELYKKINNKIKRNIGIHSICLYECEFWNKDTDICDLWGFSIKIRPDNMCEKVFPELYIF